MGQVGQVGRFGRIPAIGLPGIEKENDMAIVRWSDPIREFAHLQDRINRVFSDTYGRNDDGLVTSGAWVPAVDIYQNGDHEIVLL